MNTEPLAWLQYALGYLVYSDLANKTIYDCSCHERNYELGEICLGSLILGSVHQTCLRDRMRVLFAFSSNFNTHITLSVEHS